MNFILIALLLFDIGVMLLTNKISKVITKHSLAIAQKPVDFKPHTVWLEELIDDDDNLSTQQKQTLQPFTCFFCGTESNGDPCPCKLDSSITADSTMTSLSIDAQYKKEHKITTYEDEAETIYYDTHNSEQQTFVVGSISDIIRFQRLAEEELRTKGTYNEFSEELAYQMFLRDLCRMKGYNEDEIDHLLVVQQIDPRDLRVKTL